MELNDLRGAETGKHALLVAGGPSGKRWREVRDKVQADIVIGLNGTIVAIGKELNYWLFLDYDSPPPAWYDKGLEHKEVVKIVARPMATVYSDAIATRVSLNEPQVRSSLLGLKMFPAEPPGTRLVGTTSLCALHLCGILGCTRVSSVGIDLSFPAKQHHFYECRQYGIHPTMSGGEMEPKAFVVNDKRLVSCWWFVHSGKRLLQYRDQLTKANLDWRDYSQGLLQAMGMDNPESHTVKE